MESQTDQDIAIAQAALVEDIRRGLGISRVIYDASPEDVKNDASLRIISAMRHVRIANEPAAPEAYMLLREAYDRVNGLTDCAYCGGSVWQSQYACHRCGWKVGA